MASPFLWSPVAPDNQQQGTPSPFAGRNDFAGPNIFHQPAIQQYGGYQPQSVYDMPQGQTSRQQAQQPQQPNIFHQTAPQQQQNAQPVQNGIPQPNGGQSLSGLGQSISAPQYGQYAPLASMQGAGGPFYDINNPMSGNARDGTFFDSRQQFGFGPVGF